MDIFWLLLVFLLVSIELAISGGKDLIRGNKKKAATLKISMAVITVLLTAYLLYLDGLFYASGQPLTIEKMLLR